LLPDNRAACSETVFVYLLVGWVSKLQAEAARSQSLQSPPRELVQFPSSATDDGLFRRSSDDDFVPKEQENIVFQVLF
jgi:hypothetical protein